MFVTLGIQHVIRMRRIMLSSVACLTLPYFATLSHKRLCLKKKKVMEPKMRFFFVYEFRLKHILYQEELSEV